jgi:hypothetical protein
VLWTPCDGPEWVNEKERKKERKKEREERKKGKK